MSLDVYLIGSRLRPASGSGIFVRDNGATVEISREEWDRRYPGREPVTIKSRYATAEVYHRNITHNLGPMAQHAGVYPYLWRPDENAVKAAWQLIEPLASGLVRLRRDPDVYKPLNPENGWGTYDQLVEFVRYYGANATSLRACPSPPLT